MKNHIFRAQLCSDKMENINSDLFLLLWLWKLIFFIYVFYKELNFAFFAIESSVTNQLLSENISHSIWKWYNIYFMQISDIRMCMS